MHGLQGLLQAPSALWNRQKMTTEGLYHSLGSVARVGTRASTTARKQLRLESSMYSPMSHSWLPTLDKLMNSMQHVQKQC